MNDRSNIRKIVEENYGHDESHERGIWKGNV